MSESMSADTQVALLLCGRFKSSAGGTKPLTPGEYNAVAKWLHGRDLRPGDLLDKDFADSLGREVARGVPGERLRALLRRGTSLAVAMEGWDQLGIQVIGRVDPGYPAKWTERLRQRRPPLVYAVGEPALVNDSRFSVAIIGSRKPSQASAEFARVLGERCAQSGAAVISGAAAGVDETAMRACLDAGGVAIGVLASKLDRAATSRKWRDALREGRLLLLSEVSPTAPFAVGNAMSRNKLVYCLSDVAVVANSSSKGGTWSGALENLEHRWVPLFVRDAKDAGEGIEGLMKAGARSLRDGCLEAAETLEEVFDAARSETSDPQTGPGRTGESPGLPFDEDEIVPEHVREAGMAPPARGSNGADIVWGAFLVYLRSRVGQSVTVDDVASDLNVRSGQARDWLERAADQDLAERKTRPVRFEVQRAE